MAAPTIIRVKRCRNQDPSEVLVLSAKKRKSDVIHDKDKIKILKLATTVEVKDDVDKIETTVNEILAKKHEGTFEMLKARYKKSSSAKNRPAYAAKVTVEKARHENRYNSVTKKRALQVEDLEDISHDVQASENTESKELYRLYDIVSEAKEIKSVDKEPEKVCCNGVEMIREYVDAKNAESEYGYVYDVYFTQGSEGGTDSQDFDDALLDGLVSIQPFNTGDSLVYDQYRDDPEEFKYDDDVDSNDEDNERNEYPDEDEESCFGYFDDRDLDLEMKVEGLGLCTEDGSGLSSDEDDELLFSRTFDDDVANHGSAYARFKQKMIKEFYDDEDCDGSGSEYD